MIPKLQLDRIPEAHAQHAEHTEHAQRTDTPAATPGRGGQPPMLRSVSGSALLSQALHNSFDRSPGSPQGGRSRSSSSRSSGAISSAGSSPHSVTSPRDLSHYTPPGTSPRSPNDSPRHLQPYTLVIVRDASAALVSAQKLAAAHRTAEPQLSVRIKTQQDVQQSMRVGSPPPYGVTPGEAHDVRSEFETAVTRLYSSPIGGPAAQALHKICDRLEARFGADHPLLRSIYMAELRKRNSVTPLYINAAGLLQRLVWYCEYCSGYWLNVLYEDSQFLAPAYIHTLLTVGYYIDPVHREWLADSIRKRYRTSGNDASRHAMAALFACGIHCQLGPTYSGISDLHRKYNSYVWYHIISSIMHKVKLQRRVPATIIDRVLAHTHAFVNRGA